MAERMIVNDLGDFQGIKWGNICLADRARQRKVADGKQIDLITVRAHPKGALLLPFGSTKQIVVERGDGNNVVIFCGGMYDSYFHRGSAAYLRRVGFALGDGQELYTNESASTGSCRLYRVGEEFTYYFSSPLRDGTNKIDERVFRGVAGQSRLRQLSRKIVARG